MIYSLLIIYFNSVPKKSRSLRSVVTVHVPTDTDVGLHTVTDISAGTFKPISDITDQQLITHFDGAVDKATTSDSDMYQKEFTDFIDDFQQHKPFHPLSYPLGSAESSPSLPTDTSDEDVYPGYDVAPIEIFPLADVQGGIVEWNKSECDPSVLVQVNNSTDINLKETLCYDIAGMPKLEEYDLPPTFESQIYSPAISAGNEIISHVPLGESPLHISGQSQLQVKESSDKYGDVLPVALPVCYSQIPPAGVDMFHVNISQDCEGGVHDLLAAGYTTEY